MGGRLKQEETKSNWEGVRCCVEPLPSLLYVTQALTR